MKTRPLIRILNGIVIQQYSSAMLKMMTIADNRHFSYQNEDELVQFIASEMQKDHWNFDY